MLGIIYVLLTFLTGAEIAELFLWNRKETQKKREEIWVRLPAAYGLGTLAMGWGTYLVSSLAGIAGLKTPLFYGNLVMISVTVIFLALVYLRRYAKAEKKEKQVFSIRKGPEILELGFFVLLFAFLTWIMFYVFYIKDGVLYSGFTVYGDYAPHTAMMRSFSRSDNFPTQYPHFGGEDVRYHFMFQFLAGNLEYLGLRLDFAYNLVSVLSLGGFLMLLYALAKRMTGQRMVGIVTVLLFFFRSAFTFFRFVWEHIQNGDLWRTLTENTSFPGYTPNEDWGLWNFNVYLNQRHLAFGLLLVALALWVYLERRFLAAFLFLYQRGVEEPPSGSGCFCGAVSGTDNLLEWRGCDWRSVDFGRFWTVFFGKTGLCCDRRCFRIFVLSPVQAFYPGSCHRTLLLLGVPFPGQVSFWGAWLSFVHEWNLFCGPCVPGILYE